MSENKKYFTKKEALEDIQERLYDYNGYYCELHNEVFNTDYYILGYYQAEQALINSGYGIFGAIGKIVDYEKDNFGEVSTDFESSENVANMLYYIVGEEAMQEINCNSETFSENWDNLADDETNKLIIKDIDELLKNI